MAALVEAGDEVAQLLAEARADGCGGGAVDLVVRHVLCQHAHQLVAAPLQQDHQVCARTIRLCVIRGFLAALPSVVTATHCPSTPPESSRHKLADWDLKRALLSSGGCISP